MRISEINKREPLADIMQRTLENGLAKWHGSDYRVTLFDGKRLNTKLWYEQSLLNAYFVDNIADKPRRFLRDNFRYTNPSWKAPIQYIYGSMLASRYGLKFSSAPAFCITPEIPNDGHILIMPGNLRIRIFDFKRNITRLMLKDGFSPGSMLTEIQIRGKGPAGPFPSFTGWDQDGSWAEDPIQDAYSLPRCPPPVDRKKAIEDTILKLYEWYENSKKIIPAHEYVADICGRVKEQLEKTTERFKNLDENEIQTIIANLSESARQMNHVELAMTHGDFQPGNILVDKTDLNTNIIDWEFAAERYIHYDRLVMELRTRSSVGLANRIKSYIDNGCSFCTNVFGDDNQSGRSAISLFLLEDLLWHLSDVLNGPFISVPQGFTLFVHEMKNLGLDNKSIRL